MDLNIVFFFQVAFTLILMSLATRWWVMPRLRILPVEQALGIVLFGGAIRYMGTILLVPAIAPGVPADLTGAGGDVLCSLLALAAILANRAGSPAGRPLAWIYVVVGGADLVLTFVKGLETGLWIHLAGGWTFVVVVFPVVVLSLVLTVVFLVRPKVASSPRPALG